MTKAEAEKKRDKMNSGGPKWFCPLIIKTCISTCINYSHAYIWNDNEKEKPTKLRDTSKDNYKVQHQHCHNAMFIEMTLVCPHKE
jgi:hypothetical protein